MDLSPGHFVPMLMRLSVRRTCHTITSYHLAIGCKVVHAHSTVPQVLSAESVAPIFRPFALFFPVLDTGAQRYR